MHLPVPATMAARYAVHIDFRGASVASSPMKMRVLPIDLDASASTMGGSGAVGGFVGVESSLVVYLRDKYGNRLTVGGHESFKVTVLDADDNRLVTQIAQDQGDGTLVSKYTLNAIGDGFTLEVKTTFEEVQVVGSPRKKLMGMLDDAATVPTTSFARGAGIGPVLAAGERGDLTVFAANYLALLRTVGGDEIIATLTRPLERGGEESVVIPLADNADGTYTGAYTKTAAGFYQLKITLNSQEILGSPFTVQIVAAPSSHSYSSLSPFTAKQLGGIAGVVRSFDIQGIDEHMNFAVYDDLAGPDQFLVSLIPENIDPEGDHRVTVDATVTNNNDGTYLATYLVTVAGSYTLDVRLQPVTRQVSLYQHVWECNLNVPLHFTLSC